jgi:hypothetical protein
MVDKGFGNTSGAYLFAKIYSIMVKGAAMTVLVIDTDEELVGDYVGDELPLLEYNGCLTSP